jgi:dihydrofolate synthase/folylpolyglutamate synthase
MEFLMELAGRPDRCAPSIHIAGSKGKGSVTSMLAAMLTMNGRRAARYMSPHVIDIKERICLGNDYFSEDVYRAAGGELRCIAEELVPAAKNPLFNPENDSGCEPTFWELLTLYFFLCAKHGNCDVMVVETGMGGRLDSTNVLDPLVSVITLIELEHTAFLGNTIEAVAGEKAGIIKTGKPLVLAKQNEEVLKIFKKTANEKNSPLFYFPDTAEISNIKVTERGTDFTLSFKTADNSACCSFFPVPLSLSIPIPGRVQAENAALAITALCLAEQNLNPAQKFNAAQNLCAAQPDGDYAKINENAVRQGLANLNIPARFENITPFFGTQQPPFIIDGAHTPESLSQCIETFCSLYGEGGILLFGCAADKNAAAMAKIAHPNPACSHFTKIIITTPGTFKISNPAQVYEAFAETAGREKTLLITDTKEAIKQARDYSFKNNIPVLGTGSFYLVSEIRKVI